MESRATFRYFYGEEADIHSFYRIPKLLFTNDYFKELSNDAKILYGLMLDRMSLSVKNRWFDEENRAYIYFSIDDIIELLNCGKNKAVRTMQELDAETGIGLIEKKRQGFGKANVIYVKNFVLDEDGQLEKNQKFGNETSRISKNKLQEVYISNPNKNKYNNTYKNDTESNLILSVTDEFLEDEIGCDEMDQYSAVGETIKKNIEYDVLIQTYPNNQELVQGIYVIVFSDSFGTQSGITTVHKFLAAKILKHFFL